MIHTDAKSSDVILIIDDDVNTIQLLRGMLKDQAQLLFATSGARGIELAAQRQPQLILLDIDMPEMDGYEVCRRLKARADTRDCAVIFVTANTDMNSEVAGLDAGAVDFITKPLNPPVVSARVRTHLRLQNDAAARIQLVNKDGLTHLFNRRYVDQHLRQEFSRHLRQNLPLGIAFVDIDHFKNYNDQYGHQQGDLCLRQIADVVADATRRPGEIAARYSGKQFLCVLPYHTNAHLKLYSELICERVNELQIPHSNSSCATIVTVSVGAVSKMPHEAISIEKFIAEADQALTFAKANGRNNYRVGLPIKNDGAEF